MNSVVADVMIFTAVRNTNLGCLWSYQGNCFSLLNVSLTAFGVICGNVAFTLLKLGMVKIIY